MTERKKAGEVGENPVLREGEEDRSSNGCENAEGNKPSSTDSNASVRPKHPVRVKGG